LVIGLIWNDLSSQLVIPFFFSFGNATSVTVEAAIATVDHSDIRGSTPHNRDPSGAASDYWRGFGPEAYRIGRSRVLLSVCPSTVAVAAFLVHA
jgi:hypothetical protein